MNKSYTVASYLKIRLEQLGLDRMFGVAGNYTAAFLDTILADKDSPITISGNSNELCAGYAADGYARFKGIGALYVTYSVGAFSLLNTIADLLLNKYRWLLLTERQPTKKIALKKTQGYFIRILLAINL